MSIAGPVPGTEGRVIFIEAPVDLDFHLLKVYVVFAYDYV